MIHNPEFERWWIVYFAPSAAEFVTPNLACIFDLPWRPDHDRLVSDDCPPRKAFYPARIAAIGATTATYVWDTLHLEVRCSPGKPTPEELMHTIVESDQEDEQGIR
jgi:uroporphyrinogen-III synthase